MVDDYLPLCPVRCLQMYTFNLIKGDGVYWCAGEQSTRIESRLALDFGYFGRTSSHSLPCHVSHSGIAVLSR